MHRAHASKIGQRPKAIRTWLPPLLALVGCASAASGRGASGGSGGGSSTSLGGSVGAGTGTGGEGALRPDTSPNPGGSGGLPPMGPAGSAGFRPGSGGFGADASTRDGPSGGTTGGAGAPDGGTDAPNGAAGGSTVVPPTGPVTCGTVWKNPITTGIHDPTLIKEGNAYYVFSTADPFVTTRTVPFQTSTDLLHWRTLGSAMGGIPTWAGSLGLAGPPEVWAPDVHLVNGKYFLYYSVSSWGDVTHSAIGLMTNTTLDPTAAGYRWVDEGKVVGSPQGGAGVNVIDPDLFVDDDGAWWLVYGSYQAGVRVVPLDPSTGSWSGVTAPVVLTTSLGEGADIIKNNGFYYLFVSRGTCCAGLSSTYEIAYGRASKVTGPYVGKSGASINGASVNLIPAGTDGNPGQGGQSFFKENGQIYIAYHAYQPPSGTSILNVRPIYFDATDWVTLDPCLAKGYHP